MAPAVKNMANKPSIGPKNNTLERELEIQGKWTKNIVLPPPMAANSIRYKHWWKPTVEEFLGSNLLKEPEYVIIK